MHHNIHNKIKEEGRGCPVMGPLRKFEKGMNEMFAPPSNPEMKPSKYEVPQF
jgi:hypothetical protein